MLLCIRCQADDYRMEAVEEYRPADGAPPVPLCREHLNEAYAHAFNEAQRRQNRRRRHGDQLTLF